MADASELRLTFDRVPDLYHRARTRYPTSLWDRLEAVTGLGAATMVLEIGPASGVATEELAERGAVVTAVELGPNLAAAARRNLAAWPQVEIVEGSFDTWEPTAWGQHDLVVAASCWHWMDPATKYGRAARHLRPGGHLAFWSATHVFPEGGDRFFADIQEVYEEIGKGLPDGWVETRPGAIPDRREEIEASGRFEVVSVDQFDWEVTYDAEGYIAVLDTFSGHIAMDPPQRDRLHSEIRRRLAERPGGTLRRHYGAALHIGRRTD
ncbi:MAG: class I SAM-dependent methyltransferase [Actinomycetota bacterium]